MTTAAVLLATTLGTAAALAQGSQSQTPQAPAPQNAPDQGMMGQGGMMGHGGMMGQMDPTQMNRMMENCNRMMEGMQRSPPTPRDAQPGHG
ncbi:hypothetical protein [Dankookia sp. P2]|uniref:hypothetical protein n=1 Tax=Dankookia sp. P2 TaxID=3423955 RepID=UPI003D6678B1